MKKQIEEMRGLIHEEIKKRSIAVLLPGRNLLNI